MDILYFNSFKFLARQFITTKNDIQWFTFVFDTLHEVPGTYSGRPARFVLKLFLRPWIIEAQAVLLLFPWRWSFCFHGGGPFVSMYHNPLFCIVPTIIVPTIIVCGLPFIPIVGYIIVALTANLFWRPPAFNALGK